jgi:ABC-type hemin transport system ATPase subunit
VLHILSKWLSPARFEQSETAEPFRLTVSQGDIFEIVGRVGAGKSYFLNEVIVESLLNGIEVVYLDGNCNLNSLLFRLSQEASRNPVFPRQSINLRCLPFKNQAELIMLLHSLGNWNAEHPHRKPWIFIDSLNRTDEVEI